MIYISLPIPSSTDTWAVCKPWLLWIALQWAWECRCFFEILTSFWICSWWLVMLCPFGCTCFGHLKKLGCLFLYYGVVYISYMICKYFIAFHRLPCHFADYFFCCAELFPFFFFFIVTVVYFHFGFLCSWCQIQKKKKNYCQDQYQGALLPVSF